jgi:DNA-binding NarL/FixJ family response regulator
MIVNDKILAATALLPPEGPGKERYRPHDAPTLRAAAVELSRRGLLARDIASVLGLTEFAVRQLLAWERA